MPFRSATNPQNAAALRELELQMRRYYANPAYHDEWIRHANAGWNGAAHGAQLAAIQRIPPRARLLEIGCGDTAAAGELQQRIPELDYHGVDITIPASRPAELKLARAAADALPFPNQAFDVVISMFTIEHTVRPDRFLDETLRVTRAGGRLIVIAPDFLNNAMASERVGFGYGNGREKLRAGRLLDAALTLYDSRFRLPAQRRRRARTLAAGAYTFPILTNPRCLHRPGFLADCDAVYPACPEEIMNFVRSRHRVSEFDVFYRDASTFGLQITRP